MIGNDSKHLWYETLSVRFYTKQSERISVDYGYVHEILLRELEGIKQKGKKAFILAWIILSWIKLNKSKADGS